jgi:WD40-like Beta Propeller Repeat
LRLIACFGSVKACNHDRISRIAKEENSMSRVTKHHPAMPLMISVALSLLIQAGPTAWNASVAGDEAAKGRGKIVLRADFLRGERESDWGLFLVDPATDVWTKVAQFIPRNGTPPMPSIRVSPDGTMVVFNEYIESLHRRRVFVEKDDSFAERVAWSPDGKHLVFALLTWTKDGKGGRFLGGETYGSPRLAILDIEDGRVRVIPHSPAQRLGDPQWC